MPAAPAELSVLLEAGVDFILVGGGRRGTSVLPVAVLGAAFACVVGCSRDEPPYVSLAEGRYVELWQSTSLEGDVCTPTAAALDVRIEELSEALRVSLPSDYRVHVIIEPNDPAVHESCDNDLLGGCHRRAEDGSSLVFSSGYHSSHELVHAVQRLRPGFPHFALREGEAELFENPEDDLAHFVICLDPPTEGQLLTALGSQLDPGSYAVFHHLVARIYQDLGPDVFDQLWSASSQDPSTERLLSAFEDIVGQSLADFIAEPSLTCRNRMPGCGDDLERVVISEDPVTLMAPNSCGPGVTGAEPDSLFRTLLFEIPQDGRLSATFSGGQALAGVVRCSGFNGSNSGAYLSWVPNANEHHFEAGLYRTFIVGTVNNDVPPEVRFEFRADEM